MSSALRSSTLKLSVFIWLTLNNHLAQTIFYLQEQGFIHKNMKHEADNVLISYLKNEYHAILTDFGKCVELTAAGSLVKHFSPEKQNIFQRKHGHTAPEIVSGASAPSYTSDMFSFGRMTYAVDTNFQCSLLCSLRKKCICNDPEFKLQLCHIIEDLEALLKLIASD